MIRSGEDPGSGDGPGSAGAGDRGARRKPAVEGGHGVHPVKRIPRRQAARTPRSRFPSPVRRSFMTGGIPGFAATGRATLPIQIPNDPALAGLSTYWPGVVMASGSPLPITASP